MTTQSTSAVSSSPARHSPAGPKAIAIEQVAIAALRTDPRNARLHKPRQVRQIARSIETFGFNVPILIDSGNKVIAGHGRLLACQKLGWAQVPAIPLCHLTPEQAQAFMIADNRLTEISLWDDRLLAQQLKELSELDLDFSLDVIGFDAGDIDLRIGSLEVEEGEGDGDDEPEALQAVAVSQPGDLWQLGKHRILCASSLEEASYQKLLGKKQAKVVFTDPPYNVPIDGHVSGNGAIQHREFAMACGEMAPDEFTAFLTKICTLMAHHSKDGAIHFVCMDWRHAQELLMAGQKAYSELKNICVWAKDRAGMGTLYRSQHELVFVYKVGEAPHRNNIELGKYGRHRSNIWSYPGIPAFGKHTDEGNLLAMHPTVKPTAMVADALLDCSARGEIVLDPFLGSGTTLMAAERVKRACYGIELDPLYVDTAIRRHQKLTGEHALNMATGKTFNEIAGATEQSHG